MKRSKWCPPRLDRLLIDTDVNALVGCFLRVVGFDVICAKDEPINIRDDVSVLGYARRHRRILLTHDRYADGKTRVRLHSDLYDHGGKVIQLGGGAKHVALEAVGRILVFRQEWIQFFHDNDGIVILKKNEMSKKDRSQCHRKYQLNLRGVEPSIAPKARRLTSPGPSPRKRQVVPEQRRFSGLEE